MLCLCEVALFNRLYMSEVNGTLSTEGGLYAAISANRVWPIVKSSSIASINLHTILMGIAMMLSRTKIMTPPWSKNLRYAGVIRHFFRGSVIIHFLLSGYFVSTDL